MCVFYYNKKGKESCHLKYQQLPFERCHETIKNGQVHMNLVTNSFTLWRTVSVVTCILFPRVSADKKTFNIRVSNTSREPGQKESCV
jgi:hypothetical protein